MPRKAIELEAKKEFVKLWNKVKSTSRADDVFDLYANPFYNFFKERTVPKKSNCIVALFFPNKKYPIRCDTQYEAAMMIRDYLENKKNPIYIDDGEMKSMVWKLVREKKVSYYGINAIKLSDSIEPNKRRKYY